MLGPLPLQAYVAAVCLAILGFPLPCFAALVLGFVFHALAVGRVE